MDKDSIKGSTGEDTDNYYHEIIQPKNSKALVLIVTTFGSKEHKQEIINALKMIDMREDDDNTIDVTDIHGCNAMEPDYELPDDPVKKKVKVKNIRN